MAIFYFINRIVAAETFEGGKLFKGGNYLQKYGNSKYRISANSFHSYSIKDNDYEKKRTFHK